MDSSRKRRLSHAATPSNNDGSATKKLKLLNSNPAPAVHTSPETVQKVGLKLITQVTNATDKSGRTIADAFMELPPRDQFADYYQQIRMPIALDTIENKLRQNQYASISAIESDFRRMVQNAKDYNLPKSDIYEDSERIRKLVYNFMKQHNPAYEKEPGYTAQPTPLPEPRLTLTNGTHNSAHVKQEQQTRPGSSKTRISLVNHRRSEAKISEPPSERKSSAAPSATPDEDEEETADAQAGDNRVGNSDGSPVNRDFTGETFEDAQRIIIRDLIHRKDGELDIFTPFVHLPSRKLEDYYKIIRHPVSLKSVQKRTHGIHGRKDPATGPTDFKSWDAFEEEVSFIWRNAREYNEDGSEMYNLAGEFEEAFKSLLTQAKAKVDEPAAARLKLAGPKAKSGLMLSLSQHRESPTPGVGVDNEALARQQQMLQASMNGEQKHSRPTPPTTNGTARPPSQGLAVVSSSSGNAQSPPSAAVKHEKLATMSPAPVPLAAPAVQPVANGVVNGMMPPPVARPTSGSPYPGQPGMPPSATSYHFTAPAALPPTPLRAYPATQALLPVVAISTHTQLHIPKPYRLAIPPHSSLSHQSTTITLPPSHHILQIAPTISRELSMGRPYKMFVTLNGGRLTQRDTQFHADSGKRTHVYEGQLASGVNRIEVEVAAAKVDGDGKGLDIEKVTVFANLTR